MPLDYAALKSEITKDPLGLGYAPHVSTGDDTDIAALLNATTGKGASTMPGNPVTGAVFLAALDPGEFVSLPPTGLAQLQIYMTSGSIPVGTPQVQKWINGLWPSGNTSGALQALFTRPCSRAEVLFGANTIISYGDVGIALKGA